MVINCPSGGDTILVSPQGSGSGAGATICVHGTVTGAERKEQTVTILVRVVKPPATCPSVPGSQGGDTTVSVSGQSWCAQAVAVPAGTAVGDQLRVCAWLDDGSGYGPPQSVVFTAGGSGARDCCAEAPCAPPGGAAVARELASSPDLQVTVPDGTNAGIYTARAVAALKWSVTIAGVEYTLICAGPGLVLIGPTCSTDATSVACGPFSATFPGHLFGATLDAVVTTA
jgi:hypothetical protein